MTVEREPIFWRGHLVGHIEEPTKYPVLWRGRWIPAESEDTQRFLAALEKGSIIWVEYGTAPQKHVAAVEQCPQDTIELRLEMDESGTIHVNPFKKNG